MAISAFKTHALQVVGRVASSKMGVVITKRGKPVAQIVPYQSTTASLIPGKLAAALVFEKDIVSPLGADIWDAAK